MDKHREQTRRLCKDLIRATECLIKHLLLDDELTMHPANLREEKKNNQSEMEMTNISYDKIKNIVYIDAEKSALDPKYLKYLLQHLGIPSGVRVIFKK